MASELLNSVARTSKTYVNGLLWGDKWSGGSVTYNFFVGPYYFNNDRDFIVDGYGDTWFTSEVAAVNRALAAWSAVCNISFRQTSSGSQDIAFFNDDLFGALGLADTPSSPNVEYNTVVYNWNDPSWVNGLAKGGFGYQTILHEIGHAIGLAHPHDGGGRSTIFPGVSNAFDSGTYGMNQDAWTVMSYVSFSTHTGTPLSDVYGNIAGPMALDIAAVQHIYGADTNYRTGNNVYVLPKVNGPGAYYWCIWDAGGSDTISAAGTSTDAAIDLRWAPLVGSHAGGFLSGVEGIVGGCTIANGARIERAVGGSGNDLLIGNQFNNLLSSGAGDDGLRGLGGNDTLRGGVGADRMLGGIGKDIFDFDSISHLGLGASSDTIADFSRPQLDKIDLSGVDANADLAGNQAFNYIGTRAFGSQAGQLRYAGGILSGDTDGDGTADFSIRVENGVSLIGSDFVL